MANGIMDNEELCGSLIEDVQQAAAAITGGRPLQWCGLMVQMVQKLTNLQKGIRNDMQSRDRTIEILKAQLAEAGRPVIDYTAEDLIQENGGDNNGENGNMV